MNDYFIHPTAICETKQIGKNTRVWAFVNIQKDVSIGEECNLCDLVFIENGVSIGNRVTIKNGVAVWNGITIEDDVFLGPFCVLTNDLYPRSKVYNQENIKTLIKKGASIGANATIICGITIGSYSMVGAGSVVTKDVNDFSLVTGNPARHRYWIGKNGNKLDFSDNDTIVDSNGTRYQLMKDFAQQFKVIELL